MDWSHIDIWILFYLLWELFDAGCKEWEHKGRIYSIKVWWGGMFEISILLKIYSHEIMKLWRTVATTALQRLGCIAQRRGKGLWQRWRARKWRWEWLWQSWFAFGWLSYQGERPHRIFELIGLVYFELELSHNAYQWTLLILPLKLEYGLSEFEDCRLIYLVLQFCDKDIEAIQRSLLRLS